MFVKADVDKNGSISLNEWLGFFALMFKQGMNEDKLLEIVKILFNFS